MVRFLFFKLIKTLLHQLALYAPRVIILRHETIMRWLVPKWARSVWIAGYIIPMVTLAAIGEPGSESKGHYSRIRTRLRWKNPVKLHEVIHVYPAEVIVRDGEIGQICGC